MYFAIAALIVGLSCSAITIKILLGYNQLNLWFKIFSGFLISVAWFTPLILRGIRRLQLMDNPAFYAFLYHAMYCLFGLAFILFCLLMLRDVLWFATYHALRLFHRSAEWFNPKNPTLLGWSNLAVLGLSILVAIYGAYEAARLPKVQELTFASSKITTPIKLVFVSDMHINQVTSDKRLQEIVAEINALKPDAILFGGDIIDDRMSLIDKKVDYLKELKAPLGKFAVLGNHELYSGMPAWFMKFGKIGIEPMVNAGFRLGKNPVYVIGVPDANTAMISEFFKYNFELADKGSKKEDFKILLSHNPELDLQGHQYDLQLSGHTHGGQIYPFHHLVKSANKYLAGLYKVGEMDLYVSRGTGYWGPAMRVFAPSEITEINLVPKK